MRGYRRCCVRYCDRAARANSMRNKCEMHRQRARRHGDPTQPSIRREEWRPYAKQARRIIERGNAEKIEAGLRRIHALLLDHCREGFTNRFHAQAGAEIAKVLENVSATECGLTIGAMYLLQSHSPQRFVSNRGFDFALVRAFRARSSMSCGSTWDYRESRARKWYIDLPFRTVERMALLLRESFAPFVGALLAADRRHGDQIASVRSTLNEGFALRTLE